MKNGWTELAKEHEQLKEAAKDALDLLNRIQQEEEGPGAMPWPEIDKLERALSQEGV